MNNTPTNDPANNRLNTALSNISVNDSVGNYPAPHDSPLKANKPLAFPASPSTRHPTSPQNLKILFEDEGR